MNRLLKFAAIGSALALAAGCAPERPDATPGTEGVQRMAILASGAYGGDAEILIVDARTGNELDRIETELGDWVVGLARHPDGFFLVGSDQYVWAVEDNGDTWRFSDEPQWGGIYGITASEEGEVTIGNAEDGVTKLDEDGEVILHANMGGTCFMDSAPMPGESGQDASIDIYGPRIVVADSDTGNLEPIASNIGMNTGHLAVDNSGRFYAGSYWDDDSLWLVEDGEASQLGRLSDGGVEAQWITAMATASRDSVYVLYDGMNGSGVAEVDAHGNVTDRFGAENELWSDLVLF